MDLERSYGEGPSRGFGSFGDNSYWRGPGHGYNGRGMRSRGGRGGVGVYGMSDYTTDFNGFGGFGGHSGGFTNSPDFEMTPAEREFMMGGTVTSRPLPRAGLFGEKFLGILMTFYI